jgi:IMP cyclohydrolase
MIIVIYTLNRIINYNYFISINCVKIVNRRIITKGMQKDVNKFDQYFLDKILGLKVHF